MHVTATSLGSGEWKITGIRASLDDIQFNPKGRVHYFDLVAFNERLGGTADRPLLGRARCGQQSARKRACVREGEEPPVATVEGTPGAARTTDDPGPAHGAFPDALRAAIGATGLSLDRICYRLRRRGCRISVATLSYWQSGRTQPEREGSLLAVRHLEEVLGLPPGGLTGLLSRPRPRGRGARESRMLPMGALLERGGRLGPLLAQVDTRFDEDLIRISQHDRCRIGAHRGQVSLCVRQVLRAQRDGPDRWIIVFYVDEPGLPLPDLSALRNCRVGRRAADSEAGIMVAELLFDKALRQGETLITEHEFVYVEPQPPPGVTDVCGRTFRLSTREYLLEVLFHPAALPVRCEEFSALMDEGPARTRQVTLDGSACAHALALDFGPGEFGIRWRWGG